MIIQKLERDDPRAEVLEDLDLSFSVNSELSKGNIYVCDYTGTDPTYRGPVMVTVRNCLVPTFPILLCCWHPCNYCLHVLQSVHTAE